MNFVKDLVLALGADALLLAFCWVLHGLLCRQGLSLYFYHGSGEFLPAGTSDQKLWRQGFRSRPAQGERGFYAVRDREGIQVGWRHRLLLLSTALAAADGFWLCLSLLSWLLRGGSLREAPLAGTLLAILLAALVTAAVSRLLVRRLWTASRPGRLLLNNLGTWLRQADPDQLVMGLSFFQAVQKLLTRDELQALVDRVPELELDGDPERGRQLALAFFRLLDEKTAGGRSWLFDLTEEGVEEYRRLNRLLDTDK